MPFQINQKEKLCESLIELTGKFPIEKITIQSIVDQCGVTRTTFYRYFKDKYELLAYIFDNEMSNIAQYAHDNGLTFFDFAVEVGKMMQAKKEFFRSAFSYEGQNSFFNSVCEYNKNAFREKCLKGMQAADENIDPDAMEYLSLGYGAAAATIYRQWMLSGMHETPEEIAMIIYEACPYVFQDYIVSLFAY